MAGDWIKMRSNLWDDPRVASICEEVGCSEAAVVGGLYWLWATADQHSADGVMHGLTLRAIDRKTGIAGLADALVSVGWLADHPEGVRLARFEEHNGESAKRRCQTARRVSTHRGNAPCVTDTLQVRNDSVTGALAREREEKEKEKKEPKSKTTPSATPPATPSALPEWLPADAWQAFAAMRKTIKKPITPDAIPIAIRKLDTLRAAGNDPRLVLEQSTMNSWQGLFEIKPEAHARGSPGKVTSFEQGKANAERAKKMIFGDGNERA